MRFQSKAKKKFTPFMAMFMAFLCAFGVMPMNIAAQTQSLGEPVEELSEEPTEITFPDYIYFDGERIYLDDDRVKNIAPVVMPLAPLTGDLPQNISVHSAAESLPPVGFIVSISGAVPSNPNVERIGDEYVHPAYVTMNGMMVSSIRYVVWINNVSYEAFCADPNLPGPENPAAVYELTGIDGSQFRTVLRYGFVWRNWRNPGLTIIKQDQDTGERLAGAEFTIEAQGSGNPLPTDFPLITCADGTINIPWTLFEGESERTFIVTEVVPPPGYHLSDPNWQTVTMLAGHNNTVLFQNRRMPDLTIIKTDSVTGEAIAGAYFTVYKVTDPGRGYLSGNPFRTGLDGRVSLQGLHAGRYRVTETRAAAGYWLDPLE